MKVCSGAKGEQSMEIATNSSDPPKIATAMATGYQNGKPWAVANTP